MKLILKDYFYDFIRRFGIEWCDFLPFIGGILIFLGIEPLKNYHLLCGIPILFAILSGSLHTVSLPMMMYLIPYSQNQREDYIQKMLYAKMAIPILFTLFCDFLSLWICPISFYGFILQMLSVIMITYITGTLKNGNIYSLDKKNAYGKMKDLLGISLVLCYISTPGLFIICSNTISTFEFYLVLGIMLLIFSPFTILIGKNWKIIRRNFANYENIQ